MIKPTENPCSARRTRARMHQHRVVHEPSRTVHGAPAPARRCMHGVAARPPTPEERERAACREGHPVTVTKTPVRAEQHRPHGRTKRGGLPMRRLPSPTHAPSSPTPKSAGEQKRPGRQQPGGGCTCKCFPRPRGGPAHASRHQAGPHMLTQALNLQAPLHRHANSAAQRRGQRPRAPRKRGQHVSLCQDAPP